MGPAGPAAWPVQKAALTCGGRAADPALRSEPGRPSARPSPEAGQVRSQPEGASAAPCCLGPGRQRQTSAAATPGVRTVGACVPRWTSRCSFSASGSRGHRGWDPGGLLRAGGPQAPVWGGVRREASACEGGEDSQAARAQGRSGGVRTDLSRGCGHPGRGGAGGRAPGGGPGRSRPGEVTGVERNTPARTNSQ